MAKATTKPTQADAGELSRKAILSAASREFSAHGLAGARTDAIAESAGVNKSLIYYYFKSKSGLYAAALEEAAGMIVERTLAALDPGHSAGERLLRAALDHFDRIVTRREFQRLMQQEMVRVGRGESEPNPQEPRQESRLVYKQREGKEPKSPKYFGDDNSATMQIQKEHRQSIALRLVEGG